MQINKKNFVWCLVVAFLLFLFSLWFSFGEADLRCDRLVPQNPCEPGPSGIIDGWPLQFRYDPLGHDAPRAFGNHSFVIALKLVINFGFWFFVSWALITMVIRRKNG